MELNFLGVFQEVSQKSAFNLWHMKQISKNETLVFI